MATYNVNTYELPSIGAFSVPVFSAGSAPLAVTTADLPGTSAFSTTVTSLSEAQAPASVSSTITAFSSATIAHVSTNYVAPPTGGSSQGFNGGFN